MNRPQKVGQFKVRIIQHYESGIVPGSFRLDAVLVASNKVRARGRLSPPLHGLIGKLCKGTSEQGVFHQPISGWELFRQIARGRCIVATYFLMNFSSVLGMVLSGV